MTDKDYLQGLLQHNPVVLKAIYQNFAKRIKIHIIKSGGTADDAKDIFQDALMIIYNKAQNPDFELTSQFYTFLFGICRFAWDRKRKKKANNTVTIPDQDRYTDDTNIEQALFEREKHKLFNDSLGKLGSFCQQILALFYSEKPMKEIAQKLELKNEHTARNRKYRCQKELENIIQQDPRFSELMS